MRPPLRPAPPTAAVFLGDRVYKRTVRRQGSRATWAEGVYLDDAYDETKERTGCCLIFERTETGEVDHVLVVGERAVLDRFRAVATAARIVLRPLPPPEIGPPL